MTIFSAIGEPMIIFCRYLLLSTLLVLTACHTTKIQANTTGANKPPVISSSSAVVDETPRPPINLINEEPQLEIVPADSEAHQNWSRYNWSQQGMKPMHIGVILPIDGRYGQYGRTLLNGIRLAVSNSDWGHLVKLSVENEVGGPVAAAKSYEKLVRQGANWIIGPLLKESVQAIVPHLRKDVPVISLSKHGEISRQHPSLFMHSIARNMQAASIARDAYRHGMRSMAVITGRSASERSEAAVFEQAFIAVGGEIKGSLTLDGTKINYINRLRTFRSVIDDELQLRDLDLGLRVFSPYRKLEVRIPPSVDGLYLAMPGRMVAKLAGQLAYVDLRKIPVFGSNRWMDGHLLDDAGRYLTAARFSQPIIPSSGSRMVTHYHEAWGQGRPNALFALGYDSAHIALLLGSRLKLSGERAVQALHDNAGFPAESGHVSFNDDGVSQKEFNIFIIRNKKILLGQSKG